MVRVSKLSPGDALRRGEHILEFSIDDHPLGVQESVTVHFNGALSQVLEGGIRWSTPSNITARAKRQPIAPILICRYFAG